MIQNCLITLFSSATEPKRQRSDNRLYTCTHIDLWPCSQDWGQHRHVLTLSPFLSVTGSEELYFNCTMSCYKRLWRASNCNAMSPCCSPDQVSDSGHIKSCFSKSATAEPLPWRQFRSNSHFSLCLMTWLPCDLSNSYMTWRCEQPSWMHCETHKAVVF